MGLRRRARELALQLLYQHELTGAEPEKMQEEFEDWAKAPEDAQLFASELVEGAIANLEEIDRELAEQTAHWRVERLASVDRNILRLALYELLYCRTTPAPVVLDEAIEIAKKFGSEESHRFVNGVLDGFLKRKSEAV